MTGCKRGPKPGSTQLPWSEREWKVLREHLLDPNRIPAKTIETLAPLLPGRTPINIHNGLNRVRMLLRDKCACGLPSPGGRKCAVCLERQRDRRREYLQEGKCTGCGESLSQPGSSTTHCPRCRKRRQAHHGKDVARFRAKTGGRKRKKASPMACHRIIPWPACGHARWAAEVTARTGRPVIDLFGGVGEQLRLVASCGGQAHAYYDLDPTLAALVTYAVRTAVLARAPWPTDLYPPALAKATQKERLRRLRVLGRTLRDLKVIECKDALDVLRDPSTHPADTIFLADPPWPGSHHPAVAKGHVLDHAALMRALVALPAGQDFILSLGAEREGLRLAAEHLGDRARLYWRTSGPYGVKGLLALSLRLAGHLEAQGCTIGMAIDPAKYGVLPSPPKGS